MTNTLTIFQEVRTLLTLIRHADKDGNVDFESSEQLCSEISGIVNNGNTLDLYLYKMNEARILDYEEIGEDGFKPLVICRVSQATHTYLTTLIEKIEHEYDSMSQKVASILGFDPLQLTISIQQTQATLDEVSAQVGRHEILKPIERQLNEIRQHFNSVSAVSSRYEDIYKNIIRPVQAAGESGVKATVKWAVIGILASASVSMILGNLDTVSQLTNVFLNFLESTFNKEK
ncbi:hypothetical protein OYC61_000920 [Alcaligenes nematophilus]|uniref:AbiTii domain-containing protein n=1 Tax=Alcaligenes nematophilus TaxID=2994643 RepID=A0ABU3MMF7_9BURK|nr:hypothetical protein [Alcaligenes nematophilus]MDT8469213.1 hypothetical protein [Alcaligenes nematophilus]MDT8502848.1 hypothetical protein [Alcaligenes nematophilus]MDT8524705.1 hypothetical protein [Alcaligenes nematophilus]